MRGEAGRALDSPVIVPFGEHAWLVQLGQRVDESLAARVHALAARIEADRGGPLAGVGRPVPGYASLLVTFEPERAEAEHMEAEIVAQRLTELALDALAAPGEPWPEREPIDLPVRYGGDDGPDLEEVARRTGLGVDRVVELHAGVVYRVFLLGFAPGFAYLGPLPAELELPRRGEPRLRVAAGSVAIAGRQTAVYPFATPGGWHVLGRSDARLWDAAAEPPHRLRPGDRVRFLPLP